MDMEKRKMNQNEENEPTLTREEIKEVSSDIQDSKLMATEEENDNEDDEFDFDDVLVLPAEGMLIRQNEDEVRLLFYYVKPSMGDTLTCKAVTELRIPRKRFSRIADDIQQTMTKYDKTIQEELDLPMYA